jgi:hypothetical protein
MQAVGVLGRIERGERLAVVEPGRERVLEQAGVHARVRVEPVHDLRDVTPGGVGGQLDVLGTDPERLAIPVLERHVTGARTVVADEERAQPRDHAAFGEVGDAGTELVADGGRELLAVEDRSGHVARS